MKIKTASFLCGLTLTMGLLLGSATVLAAPGGDIPIDEDHFPDSNFRTYISDNLDRDADDALSAEELLAVTGLDIHGRQIGNLDGIDLFENLQTLDCSDNMIDELDLDTWTTFQKTALYGDVREGADTITYTSDRGQSLTLDKTVRLTATAPSLETMPLNIHWDGVTGKIRWDGGDRNYSIRILTNLDNGEYRRTGKTPAASEWASLPIDTFLMYSGDQVSNEFDIAKLLDTATLQARIDVYNDMVRNGQTLDQFYVNRMDPYNKTGIFVSRAGTANVGGMFCVEIEYDRITNYGDEVHFKNSARIWIDYSDDCYPSEVLNARIVEHEDGMYLQWDPIVNVTEDDTLRITADGVGLAGNVNLYSRVLPATTKEISIHPILDSINEKITSGAGFFLGFGVQFEVTHEDENGNCFKGLATDFFSLNDVEEKEVIGHWGSAESGFVFSWGAYSLEDLGLDYYSDMTRAELVLKKRSLDEYTSTMENAGREVYTEILSLNNGELAAGSTNFAEKVLENGDGWYEAYIRTIPKDIDRSGSIITSSKIRMFRMQDHLYFEEQSPANGESVTVTKNGELALHYLVHFPEWLSDAGYELVFSDITVIDGNENAVAVYPVDYDETSGVQISVNEEATALIGEYFADYSVTLVQSTTCSIFDTLNASFEYKVAEDILAETASYSVIYLPAGGTGKMAVGTLKADEENYATMRFPDCDFNAPDGRFFDGWEWKYEDEFWEEARVAAPGSRVRVVGDITVRPIWSEKKGHNVSGHITSYGDETQVITVYLVKDGDAAPAYTTSVTGKSTDFVLEDVEDGAYTLTVEKINHVSRSYEVSVAGEDVMQDALIRLLGDVTGDGKVNAKDHSRLYAHVNKTSMLTGYELQCADVTKDGKINAKDHSRLYAHVNKTNMLY